MYSQLLLENNSEIKRMKQRLVDFEKEIQDRLDEYDRNLQDRVEERLELIQRAFVKRLERSAADMLRCVSEIGK